MHCNRAGVDSGKQVACQTGDEIPHMGIEREGHFIEHEPRPRQASPAREVPGLCGALARKPDRGVQEKGEHIRPVGCCTPPRSSLLSCSSTQPDPRAQPHEHVTPFTTPCYMQPRCFLGQPSGKPLGCVKSQIARPPAGRHRVSVTRSL